MSFDLQGQRSKPGPRKEQLLMDASFRFFPHDFLSKQMELPWRKQQ